MRLIDLILSIVCVLLWISWRMAKAAPDEVRWHRTLLHTLRRATSNRWAHWGYLCLLLTVLALRGVIYHKIGENVGWVPQLNFEVVTIPFRSDRLGLMMLFSLLSFGLLLGGFYLWLLLLSVANREVPDSNPMQRLVRVNLGWLERLPVALKWLLPVPAAGLCWVLLSLTLTRQGLLPPPVSTAHLVQQGLVAGVTSLLVWKSLIVGVLFLHLMNNYIYVGHSPFWDFVEAAGRRFVAPLRWLPLRVGRLDFAPVVVMAVVLLAAQQGGQALVKLYYRLPL